MENKIQILCTRPVNNELIKVAAEKNIRIDVLSFIETAPMQGVEVQQEIEHALTLSVTVVFTSMNAVDAVVQHLEEQQPAWKIYCIGNTTRELAEHYFTGMIMGTADNAAVLAELIAAESSGEEVVFFCGDQRRDELVSILLQNDIEVTEIIVYETKPLPHKIKVKYAGILFFSPSAVKSFFSVNKADPATVLFAIGSTTASAIAEFCSNRIMIADSPGKDELVEKMIEYFGG